MFISVSNPFETILRHSMRYNVKIVATTYNVDIGDILGHYLVFPTESMKGVLSKLSSCTATSRWFRELCVYG